jgi:hypothetical protein
MISDLGKTRHFYLEYDDSLSAAKGLASAVMATCEQDLSRLTSVLPSHLGLGTDPYVAHPIQVQLVDLPKNRGGGNNSKSGSNGLIHIGVLGANGVPVSDNHARFVFVAEMAEQLMGAYGWDMADSQGEALSRVMATDLYPDAAYSSAGAPWSNPWLASSRQDWVKTAEPTDIGAQSFGCGILFINYVRHQLKKPFSDFCLAGGTTMLDRYRNLTGNTDDPLKAMTDLLVEHFGKGIINLSTDDPFPLLDGSQRSVSLAFESAAPYEIREAGAKVHIKPFVNCPAADYSYDIVTRRLAETVSAIPTGFGRPEFTWKVAGHTLPADVGDIVVDASLTVPVPADPDSPQRSTQKLKLHYFVENDFSRDRLASNLILWNLDLAGTYQVDVAVEVRETFDDTHFATTGVATQTFITRLVDYEKAYWDDRQRCGAFLRKTVESHRLGKVLDLAAILKKNIPDPYPVGTFVQFLERIDEIRHLIAEYAVTDPVQASNLAQVAAESLNLPSHLLTTVRNTRPVGD